MDKRCELKKLRKQVENLNQEKLDNKKVIKEIEQEENSIDEINKDIEDLKYRKVNIGVSFFLKIAAIVLAIISIVIIATGISLGEAKIINIIFSSFISMLGVSFFGALSYFCKHNCVEACGCSSIKEINSEIEEKEQQKELVKSKIETNKEIIREKEEKNSEIDIKLKKCVTDLIKYEEVQNDLVNKFLNSPEFIQAMNSQMSMLLDEEKELDEKGNAYQKRK